MLVTDIRSAPTSWPVGWPPRERRNEVIPKLFEFIRIEIIERPLADVLAAIAERLESPLLLDHAALDRQQIDPETAIVSFPAGRSYYKQILDRVLFQARLKGEVRVDELGQPLVWITTLK
jgi:hypothetical protein